MQQALDDTTPIKAIETLYDGIRFRSRLEARWAVFFDCLELRYLYEHEGYTDGVSRYLPDFFLPELNAFVEIKPAVEFIDPPTMRKANMLLKTGKPVYIFAGEVGCRGRKVGQETDFSAARGWAFWHCAQCRKTSITASRYNPACCCNEQYLMEMESPQLVCARLTAKQVRFGGSRTFDRRDAFSICLDAWTEGMKKVMESPSTLKMLASQVSEKIRDWEEDDLEIEAAK